MPSSRRALIVASLLAAPLPLAAQSIWITPLTGKADLDLEWTRPTFESGSAAGPSGNIWIATGRLKIGEGGALVVAVPRFSGGGMTSYGNPYVGYQASEGGGKTILNLGIRIPNVSGGYSTDQLVAIRGDFGRFEETLPKTLTIHAEAQGKVWSDSSGADVQVRGGATILHPTDAASGDNNTFLFDYGVRFGRGYGHVALGAGVIGRIIMSGDAAGFYQRNATEGTVDLAWRGRVTPRIALRIPATDNLKHTYTRALIFGLEVALP